MSKVRMNLRIARIEKGLSQEELGKAIGGATQAQVSLWEKGHGPGRKWAQKLEAFFGKPATHLLDENIVEVVQESSHIAAN